MRQNYPSPLFPQLLEEKSGGREEEWHKKRPQASITSSPFREPNCLGSQENGSRGSGLKGMRREPERRERERCRSSREETCGEMMVRQAN